MAEFVLNEFRGVFKRAEELYNEEKYKDAVPYNGLLIWKKTRHQQLEESQFEFVLFLVPLNLLAPSVNFEKTQLLEGHLLTRLDLHRLILIV